MMVTYEKAFCDHDIGTVSWSDRVWKAGLECIARRIVLCYQFSHVRFHSQYLHWIFSHLPQSAVPGFAQGYERQSFKHFWSTV
jgi:hypothetical protein